MNKLQEKLEINPIIAAVSDLDKLNEVIESPCEVVFLLTGDLFNLSNTVNTIKDADMDIYVHVDLLDGFANDMTTLRFINEKIKPDGIITTKSKLIKKAKTLGMCVVQRIFALDSLSIDTGVKSINATKPDAVEIMPGIVPRILEEIKNHTSIPIIAGGLISRKEDVIQGIKAGAVGISTSKSDIWNL